MILLPFFDIPHGDRLAKNVKSRCVQVLSRSTAKFIPTQKCRKDTKGLYIFAVYSSFCRNMNQTMSTSRRVAMYVTPVAILSICLNIPKFMETQIKETDNSTEIDVAGHYLDSTYRLYFTISQIFHPTLTTGLVPMGILIFMNLNIFKGKL